MATGRYELVFKAGDYCAAGLRCPTRNSSTRCRSASAWRRRRITTCRCSSRPMVIRPTGEAGCEGIRNEIRFLAMSESALADVVADADAARLSPPAERARHQGGLRRGRLRRLHRAGRPAARRASSSMRGSTPASVPRLARRLPCRDGRASAGDGRRAASGAAGDGRFPRLAMRFLHAGLRHVALRAVDDEGAPTDRQRSKDAAGQSCRCTGYEAIVRAALAVCGYGHAAKDRSRWTPKGSAPQASAMRDGADVEIGDGKRHCGAAHRSTIWRSSIGRSGRRHRRRLDRCRPVGDQAACATCAG